MMDNEEMLQQMKTLRAEEAELKSRLVDPVAELWVADETLHHIHLQQPLDTAAAQAAMTNILFLRRVIRNLVASLAEVQQQIRQIEDALNGTQGDLYKRSIHASSKNMRRSNVPAREG